jgi:uncharacterized membrane protein YhiD involved in acid resistance
VLVVEEQYNFNDIIKNSFLKLDTFASVQIVDILLSLFVSLSIGLFIHWVYKRAFRGVVFSHNFNITLVLMTLITSLIIMTISTNVVLSLGMVGALSIVRFRTAIKDPLDIVYMFWAIAAGIAAGARVYAIALIGSLFIGLVIFFLTKSKSSTYTYMLVIRYEIQAYYEIKQELKKMKYLVKSKIVRHDMTELTVELKLKVDNTSFINTLSSIDGVKDVSLVHYNGDYAV